MAAACLLNVYNDYSSMLRCLHYCLTKKKLAKLLDDVEQFWTVECEFITAEDDVEFKQNVRFVEKCT